MQILILLEGDNGDAVSAICDATIETTGAGGIAARLANLNTEYLAVIVSPDASDASLRAAVADCGLFTVEVQPDNIASNNRLSANADAELFGLGMNGYALACDLIRERSI